MCIFQKEISCQFLHEIFYFSSNILHHISLQFRWKYRHDFNQIFVVKHSKIERFHFYNIVKNPPKIFMKKSNNIPIKYYNLVHNSSFLPQDQKSIRIRQKGLQKLQKNSICFCYYFYQKSNSNIPLEIQLQVTTFIVIVTQ